MKIALVTTVWDRMEITVPVLEHYSKIAPDDVFLTRIAVCSSEKEANRIQKIPGWDVTFYLNEPLSEKHNQGVQYARRTSPDAVCVVNSDDVISEGYFDYAADQIEEHRGVVRFLSSVMVDTVEGRGAYVPRSFPMSGAVLSREVLDTLNWRPWEGEGINKWLDQRLGQNLEEIGPVATGIQPTHEDGIQLCSLKSGQQIWSYEKHLEEAGSNIEVDPIEYLDNQFPHITDLVADAVQN